MNRDDNTSEKPAVSREEDEGEVLEWTSHPLRRKPVAATIVSIFILVVSMVVYSTTMSKAFGVLALVVLFASLARFYFPTTYRLTGKRITVKTVTQTLHKDWSQYRTCYPDKNGILLSPFTRPSRLESFRGIYLIFSANKQEVVSFVKGHIGKREENSSQHEAKDK